MPKTSILKLKNHNESQEIDFEIDFILSLDIPQRFEMMEEKNRLIKMLLEKNGYRKTSEIIKRK